MELYDTCNVSLSVCPKVLCMVKKTETVPLAVGWYCGFQTTNSPSMHQAGLWYCGPNSRLISFKKILLFGIALHIDSFSQLDRQETDLKSSTTWCTKNSVVGEKKLFEFWKTSVGWCVVILSIFFFFFLEIGRCQIFCMACKALGYNHASFFYLGKYILKKARDYPNVYC